MTALKLKLLSKTTQKKKLVKKLTSPNKLEKLTNCRRKKKKKKNSAKNCSKFLAELFVQNFSAERITLKSSIKILNY